MNDRILRWFHPGGQTADIGSGSGINLDWLVKQGFPAVGYEPVAALRALSQREYPAIDVRDDALPDLATIPDGSYANVLCSAVLMHVPEESVALAVASLVRILELDGRLVLTYRHGYEGRIREADDRLFTPLDINRIGALLQESGASVKEQTIEDDPARPGVQWTVFHASRS